MKILLSPIGKQDPHGKRDKTTGEWTLGSALTICTLTEPDAVVLLPTRCALCREFPAKRCGEGEGGRRKCTYQNAVDTKDEMELKWTHMTIEVLAQDMIAPNDYEEAQQMYGDALTTLARTYPNAELVVNASSGTPAIKLACLMTIAEERISGTPYYADDPTESEQEQRVRPLKFTFLRESALMQRSCDLIRRGQFGLAQDPLDELSAKASAPTRKIWARYWKQWMTALQSWDERSYSAARQSLAAFRSEWLSPPGDIMTILKVHQQVLDKIANPHQRDGFLAWDLYFQAKRLQTQGHLTATLEHLWIAIESSTSAYVKREYADVDTSRYELRDALELLETKRDTAYTKLWASKWQGKSMEAWFRPLRLERNAAIHNGKPAAAKSTDETDELAQRWLSALGGTMPTDYPMSPESLSRLASLFSAQSGL